MTTKLRGAATAVTVILVMWAAAGPIAWADDVSTNPNAKGLPGAGAFQTLIDWTAQITLYGALAAILGGGISWGLSQRAGYVAGGENGRRMMEKGATTAFIVGLAATAVNVLTKLAGGKPL